MEIILKVAVLSMRGQCLMPCSPRKARVLLREKKAVVKQKSPFTIQLTIPTGETKQEVTLGVMLALSILAFLLPLQKQSFLPQS